MRPISIFYMVLDAVPLLLMAAVLVLAVFAVGYLVIYRKIMKGKKKLKLTKVLWILLFVSYIAVLFVATLLRHSSENRLQAVYPLFYSYRSAWNTFNVTEWRNIILNILMFVPFGFLLPCAFDFFKKFWRTYIAGFAVTLGIESVQLIFRLGIFECDDIFNNFLGVMVGYGCYAIVRLIADLVKKRTCSAGRTLALQIPLLGVILLFGVIFAAYSRKELGNPGLLSITPETGFEIIAAGDYNTDTRSVMVYRMDSMDREQADTFAKDYFEMLGTALDETRSDYYDETAVYYSTDLLSLWVDYAGKKYNYTDFSVGFGNDEIAVNAGASEEEIRSVLQKYGVELPKEAVFENQGDGSYCFSVELLEENGTIQDGVLRCTYYVNGVMGDIDNSILTGVSYKNFEIISEQEAYEMICEGKVRMPAAEETTIVLGGAELSYRMDSKGYYVPVYQFEAEIGNYHTQIEVPAVR